MSVNYEAVIKIGAQDAGASETIGRMNTALKQAGQQGQLSAKAISNAYRQLPAQFQDIAVSLAGGQNPLMVLLQQGSQIATQFGGVGNAIRSVGSLALSSKTPIMLLAAAVGAFAMAAYKGATQSEELANKLTLMGGAAGATADEVEAAVKRIDGLKNVSSGDARGIVMSLLGTFDPSMFDQVGALIVKISQLSGQTTEEVTKHFGDMAKGVAEWAAKNNKAYNYLTADQYKYIKALEDSGDKEGALRENMRLLDAAFKEREAQIGTLQRLWYGLRDAASSAWDAMLGIGREKPVAQQIADLEAQLDTARKAANMPKVDAAGAFTGGTYGDDIPAIEARIAALRKLQEDQSRVAQDRAKFTEEQAKIDAIASGKAAALADAQRDKLLAAERAASAARVQNLETERARIDAQHAAGLLSDRTYAEKKLDIRKRELGEQARLVQFEIDQEQRRSAVGADAIKRDTKVIELRQKLAEINGQMTIEGIKAEGEIGAIDYKAATEGAQKFLKVYEQAQEAIRELVNENAATAAELVVDPMERARQQLEAEFAKIDAKYAELRANLVQQRDIAGASGQFQKSEQLSGMIEQLDQAIEKSKELARMKGPPTTWMEGAKRGLQDYAREALNTAEQMQEVFNRAFNALEDVLVDFFTTGKASFKDFLNAIVSDLMRALVRSQITGPLAKALSGVDFGSIIGNIFGGARAEGGPVDSGKTYLVGENGPELFTASRNGTIIPNHALSGGGQPVTVNVINNADGTRARTEQRQDGNGGMSLDVIIEQVESGIARNVQRGGGIAPALERQYGLNRAAGAFR